MLSEHGPIMKSCEAISGCLWEHSQEYKKEPCDFSFFKTELFLECSFMLFLGVADKSEFTSDYLLLLATIIQLNV